MKRGEYEKQKNQILVEHPNGYYGCLYGKRSLSVYKDGIEVLHTGFRTVDTPNALWDLLDGMDDFLAMIKEKNG